MFDQRDRETCSIFTSKRLRVCVWHWTFPSREEHNALTKWIEDGACGDQHYSRSNSTFECYSTIWTHALMSVLFVSFCRWSLGAKATLCPIVILMLNLAIAARADMESFSTKTSRTKGSRHGRKIRGRNVTCPEAIIASTSSRTAAGLTFAVAPAKAIFDFGCDIPRSSCTRRWHLHDFQSAHGIIESTVASLSLYSSH